MKRTVPPALRDAVAAALEKGPLFWSEYKQIRERHQATLEDFIAMVLQDRLVWSLLPFTASRVPRVP